ncbi:hypothetical protein GXW83_28515 [Streptacidiphilus sp. PB12-B1b]|uniref:hypothetical protein n=1 Tax=Streptacidiphilus sp. PB12-B1b TaxID=2705012 RepID=UPI0015FC864D|nr:hypothetical protein [Streptacidiphilus sp. PB12-B1b]QMU79063.1 hypothetical protein GXW83_28515 [Streptacidiphilus sp. PB12-B1b]
MSSKPTAVPFITARAGEDPSCARLVALSAGRGIGYQDERPEDRDERGVLWGRVPQLPVGRPRWKDVHPQRQRICMERLLCQVCTRPADHNHQGWLFLRGSFENTVSEGVLTAQPPLCLAHALLSAEQCRYLADGFQAMRVQHPLLFGVLGTSYILDRFAEPMALPPGDPVPYTHPRVPWVLASQLVRCLLGVTDVDLEQESARPRVGLRHPGAAEGALS